MLRTCVNIIFKHLTWMSYYVGYDITVVDNLINSSKESLNRIREVICRDPVTGSPLPDSRLRFHNVDLCNYEALENVFKEHSSLSSKPFQACIHFAGLKAVGESVQKPLLYYKNNLGEYC